MTSSHLRTIAIVAIAMVVVACGDSYPDATATPSDLSSAPPTASPSAASSPIVFGEWRSAAPMTHARTGFDAVVLGDGTVLAVGDDRACLPGPAEPGSETAEQYDPVADAWAEVPSLNKPRKEAATVAMFDGSAMVLGGLNDVEEPFSSTKQFETETGTWTDGPLMVLGRSQPLAATLPDGRVLAVSHTGAASEDPFTSEIFDPANGSWIETASLPRETWIDAIVALAGGTVLAVGSFEGDTEPTPVAYVYDPAADAWAGVQGLPGYGFQLVALPDGGALAIGGTDGGELSGGTGGLTAAIHRFELGRGVWTTVTPMSMGRDAPQVAVLGDGRVLVAGGAADGQVALTSTETYDPATDRWTPGPELLEGRYGGHALALSDGSVLILGGASDFNTAGDTPWCPTPLVTTELLDAGS
jgi:Kelch motif